MSLKPTTMFWKKKEKQAPNDKIRETLFGDMPINEWAKEGLKEEPWSSFLKAKNLIAAHQDQAAIEVLQAITRMNNLESRHYAQAYHFLKELGQVESAPTKLLGVVIEVDIESQGYDLLAAYPDLSARYYNYTGAGIVWEHPNNSIDEEIKAVLHLGEEVMHKIGPWDGPRPQPVKNGMVRLNLLTSKGLHFGEAPMNTMAADPIGGGLLNAGAGLMQVLINKTGK